MGSLNFSAHEKQVIVELHTESDPYHGCDNADCCWTPDAHETMYLDIKDAKKLRRQIDAAIKQAQRITR